MPRRFSATLILLLIAVALNPLIAWACVLYRHRFIIGTGQAIHVEGATERSKRRWIREFGPSAFIERYDHEGDDVSVFWPYSHWEGTNQYLLTESRHTHFGFTDVSIYDDLREHGPLAPALFVCEAGWPAPGMQCTSVASAGSWRTRDALEVTMVDARGRRSGTHLPLRPLWPCFAINTLLYALMLAAMGVALGYFKRRMRVHRGRCANCSYNMRGTPGDVCPECGACVQR